MRPGLSRAQLAWAFFDWANQPYFTLILTFIYGAYFATRVVGDPVAGQALWGYLQAAAGLVIALSGPVLGAVADAGGRRKPWCAAFSALGCLGAAGLWLAIPGGGVWLAGGMMLMATIGFEIAIIFYNALLPGLASPQRMGFLSGFGWGLGYVGGLAALALILATVYLPAVPAFGLSRAMGEDARIVGPFSAVWFLVFALPFFFLTPDGGTAVPGAAGSVRQGLATLGRTLGHLRRYRTVLRFLIARMLYADGLAALFTFGGIYAAGTFHWGTTQMGIFGIITLVFSAIGAFLGGWADDRFGAKPTILTGLFGLGAAILLALSLKSGSLMFGVLRVNPGHGAITSAPEFAMLLAAVIIGICAGPVQAASRGLMARLAPPGMAAEFFGLYAFSGKATAFVAPFLIGLATDWSGSQGLALLIVLIFLGAGGVLLARTPVAG